MKCFSPVHGCVWWQSPVISLRQRYFMAIYTCARSLDGWNIREVNWHCQKLSPQVTWTCSSTHRPVIYSFNRNWSSSNTRPIVYVGSDDHLTLSPADLLQQHTTLGLPDITVKSDDPDFVSPGTRINMASVLLDAWRRGQNIVNNFWKLWREDYLTALREKQTSDLRRMKPTTSQHPHIDDVVQVYHETFRGSWKVGRITRVLMSRDGKVRAAEVQLANGHIIDRPISKLYPLESSTPRTTAKPESERRQSTRLTAIRARERLVSPSLY